MSNCMILLVILRGEDKLYIVILISLFFHANFV